MLHNGRSIGANGMQLVVVWGKKSLNFGVKADYKNTDPKIN
jgi:hypothetical protein